MMPIFSLKMGLYFCLKPYSLKKLKYKLGNNRNRWQIALFQLDQTLQFEIGSIKFFVSSSFKVGNRFWKNLLCDKIFINSYQWFFLTT